MVKGTKSNPVSKRDGVKKELAFKYQLVTKINLTAMPFQGVGVIIRKSEYYLRFYAELTLLKVSAKMVAFLVGIKRRVR